MKLNRYNQTKYFLLPFLMLLLVSCEEEVDISIRNVDDKVVVVSTFTPNGNEPFSLNLSKSSSLFSESSPQALEQAVIQICKGENCELLGPPENVSGGNDGRGIMFTTRNFRPQVNIPFTLKVNVDGVSPISAQSIVPETIEMAHVAVGASTQLTSDQPTNNEVEYETRIALSFDDPAGEDNYYQVNFQQLVITNGNLEEDTISIPNVDYLSIDADLVNLRNVTDGGILIDGKDFDGLTRDLLFRPTFKYNALTENPISIAIELRTVSKEYFDYYSSVFRQINQGSDPFIQPVQIVSNINNGLGIFAGYSKSVVVRDLDL